MTNTMTYADVYARWQASLDAGDDALTTALYEELCRRTPVIADEEIILDLGI